MTSQNLHPLCMDQFSFFYNCLDGKNDQTLDLSTFSALSDETVAHYNQIPEAPDSKDLLSKLAVIKLNGGLCNKLFQTNLNNEWE